jgi:endonuclease YncB( thermonuclease family)
LRNLHLLPTGALWLAAAIALLIGNSLASRLGEIATTAVAASQPDLIGRASVIDGDTIEIHGQRIRIWGIDAPESRQLCHVQGNPWRCGQRAALALSDWIGHQTVACAERDRDRYGRVVATCSVAGEGVAVWLVRHGWALDWPRYSKGAYAGPQREAAAARAGIWQGDFEKPWEWRHRQ